MTSDPLMPVHFKAAKSLMSLPDEIVALRQMRAGDEVVVAAWVEVTGAVVVTDVVAAVTPIGRSVCMLEQTK